MPRSIEQKRSRKQEQKTAKEINGRATPASGSRWHSKGDIRSDKFLIECKTTTKDSYRLTAKTWEKIAKEALRDGIREPTMRIDLCNEFGDIVSFIAMYSWAYDVLCKINLGSGCFNFMRYSEERNSYLVKTDHEYTITRFILFGEKYHDVVIFPWGLFVDCIVK